MKQENANDDYEALDPLDSGNSVYIGGGSDFEGELKKVNVEFPRRCVAKRKLKRKLNQKSSARKSTDNRAHINRDNWNEESTAALIAQVEKYPGSLFHVSKFVSFIALPFHSHLGCSYDRIPHQNFERLCVDEGAQRR